MPACGGNYTFIDIANPWVGDGGEAVWWWLAPWIQTYPILNKGKVVNFTGCQYHKGMRLRKQVTARI